MSRFFGKLCFVFAAVVSVAVLAVSAQAAEVKTKYFSIDLPDGWVQPQPVQEAEGTLVAVFVDSKTNTAVTVSVATAPMSAKDIAEQTVTNMKSGGLTPSAPVEKNGLYEITFSQGGGKGQAWFGSNGKEFAVTMVVGASVESGMPLLKTIKSTDAKLFPKW